MGSWGSPITGSKSNRGLYAVLIRRIQLFTSKRS